MRPPRRLLALAAASTTVLLATSALFLRAAAASTAPGPPASVSLSVSTSQLPSSGGSVVIHLDFGHVDRCRLYASSQVRGERRWGSCTGAKAERLWFPAQGSSIAPVSYRLLAIGSSPSASASSAATVVVGRWLSVLTETNNDWAGVVAVGVHEEVSASWVVPAVTGCTGALYSYSYTWVGLGTNRLVQGGTIQQCDPAVATGTRYIVWIEDYPTPIVGGFTVSPGDVIRATATQMDGVATIVVDDGTNGQSMSRSFPGHPPLRGAEWVEEDPAGGTAPWSPAPVPFAHFGSVVFTAMSLDGAPPSATASPLERFLVSGTTLKLTSTSADADRLVVADVGA